MSGMLNHGLHPPQIHRKRVGAAGKPQVGGSIAGSEANSVGRPGRFVEQPQLMCEGLIEQFDLEGGARQVVRGPPGAPGTSLILAIEERVLAATLTSFTRVVPYLEHFELYTS